MLSDRLKSQAWSCSDLVAAAGAVVNMATLPSESALAEHAARLEAEFASLSPEELAKLLEDLPSMLAYVFPVVFSCCCDVLNIHVLGDRSLKESEEALQGHDLAEHAASAARDSTLSFFNPISGRIGNF